MPDVTARKQPGCVPLGIDSEGISEVLEWCCGRDDTVPFRAEMLPQVPMLYLRKLRPEDEGAPVFAERDACSPGEFGMYPARDVARNAVRKAEADLETSDTEHTSPECLRRLAQARRDEQAVLAAERELRWRVVLERRSHLSAPSPLRPVARARSSIGVRRRPGVRRAARSSSTGPPGDSDSDAPGEPAPAEPHDLTRLPATGNQPSHLALHGFAIDYAVAIRRRLPSLSRFFEGKGAP